jgi:hypothetical protein
MHERIILTVFFTVNMLRDVNGGKCPEEASPFSAPKCPRGSFSIRFPMGGKIPVPGALERGNPRGSPLTDAQINIPYLLKVFLN